MAYLYAAEFTDRRDREIPHMVCMGPSGSVAMVAYGMAPQFAPGARLRWVRICS